MRIIAFGDIHMERGNLEGIPGIAAADLLVITGDITNFGGRTEAARVLDHIMSINPRVLALPGNLDRREVDGYLSDLGLNLHKRGQEVGGIGFFGAGGSNLTPFHTPTEFNEEELASFLRAGHAQIGPEVGHQILISHPPPHGTTLDIIAGGVHVGSTAVRSFIEEFQPDLCVTGHIHEARGEDRLGRTRIINPGMIGEAGWVEIVLEKNELRAALHLGIN